VVPLLGRQGGDCFYKASMKYHNSYIIADTNEAWVLETADKYWVAERVNNIRSISNGYTIGKHWDLASTDLVKHAVEKGWCQSEQDFDFMQCYGDAGMREIVHCVERAECTTKLMLADSGKITVNLMMGYLKKHDGYDLHNWNPDKQINTICMHAGPEVVSQSTASYVGHLSYKACENWFNVGSSPCISAYIPFYMGYKIQEVLTKGGESYQGDSYWWKHEKLVRLVQEEYPRRASVLEPAITKLQYAFLREADKIGSKVTKLPVNVKNQLLKDFTAECTHTAAEKINEWLRIVEDLKPTSATNESYLDFLKGIDEIAGIKISKSL